MNKTIKTIIISLSLFLTQYALADQPATAKPAKPAETAAKPAASQASTAAGQVNINTADAATLAKELNGIGDVKAQAIVDYRTKNGPFKTVEDLANVTGIGAATIEKNKSKVVLQ